MISYRPLWETMASRNITTYTLIHKYNFSAQTISNLKHNKGITTFTLEKLCKILECTPDKVIEFI
ncbi:MAG: helix-turn-helix transcriptional regulator [Acetatifactor sp.]|nr:helix-turn-helix transcriptional regulator [Acetatifactor sp.]